MQRVKWSATLGKWADTPLLLAGAAVALGIVVASGVLLGDLWLLGLLAMAGLGLIWLVFQRPDVGLALLIFTTYARAGDVLENFHGIPSPTLPLALAVTAAVIWRWWVYGERLPNWEIPALLVGVFLLVNLLSLFYAAYPERSLAALMEIVQSSLLLFAVFLTMRRRQSLRYAVWALLAAGVFMGTMTVIQQLSGAFHHQFWGFAQTEVKSIVGTVKDHRVAGPVGSPNYYAMILVVLVPIALDRVWHEERTALRLVAFWALAMTVLSIVFTFSRGGFVALVAVVALMLARYLLNWRRVFLFLGMFLVLWQFVPGNYTARLATTLELFSGEREIRHAEVSFRGRASEMWAAWQMFRDQPLLGVGLDNYRPHYQTYARPLGLDDRREERAAHSLYLEIAAETGVVGLLAMGAILATALAGTWRAHLKFHSHGHETEAWMSRALAIGMVGFLVASVLLHRAYPRYFWLLLGILLATPHVANGAPRRSTRPYVASRAPAEEMDDQ